MNERKIAATILKVCLGYHKGERLLIITDGYKEDIAKIFFKYAVENKIKVNLLKIPALNIHGQEPGDEVKNFLKIFDLALLITKMSLSHTKARQQASKKGVRIASLPNISIQTLRRAILINYSKLREKTMELARILTKAKTITVKTKKGTDLTMNIEKRDIFQDNGLYIKAGDFGNLPAGEVCVAPVEGTAYGKIIIDASFASIGRLHRPIRIEVNKGYATKISLTRLRKILLSSGRCSLSLAEFGIGLNPKARISGNVLEDEKVLNTAHIAFGNNKSFGGKIDCPLHLDGVFFNPSIFIDGKELKLKNIYS